MSVRLLIGGTRAVIENGVWHSSDPALTEHLRRLTATFIPDRYTPDFDYAAARDVERVLHAVWLEYIPPTTNIDEVY